MKFRAKEPVVQDKDQTRVASILSRKGLVVWGTIHDGLAELEPAFEAHGVSSTPEPGKYTLLCLDADRKVLQSVPFEAEVCPDLPEGEDIRSFAFVIPRTPAMEAGMASMEIQCAGETLGSLGAVPAHPSAGGHALAMRRGPVAVALHPGTVHLGWDAVTHPQVIVRDAATGEDLTMATGGSIDLATDARELELVLSDGLRSISQRIHVRNGADQSFSQWVASYLVLLA